MPQINDLADLYRQKLNFLNFFGCKYKFSYLFYVEISIIHNFNQKLYNFFEVDAMKEALRKYWHFYLAALLLALGMFFLGRAHAVENPHAFRHIEMHYNRALIYDNCYGSVWDRLFRRVA